MNFIKELLGCGKKQIVFLVDGPNTIRKSIGVDLNEALKEVKKYGNVKIAKVYVDQYASEKLIEAMINQGFEVEITSGDVDVTMAVEGMEYVMQKDVDILALMTRDSDFIPVLKKAKKYGKHTIVAAVNSAFSVALKNTADVVIIVNKTDKAQHIINTEI